jgi:hypothetical protein
MSLVPYLKLKVFLTMFLRSYPPEPFEIYRKVIDGLGALFIIYTACMYID